MILAEVTDTPADFLGIRGLPGRRGGGGSPYPETVASTIPTATRHRESARRYQKGASRLASRRRRTTPPGGRLGVVATRTGPHCGSCWGYDKSPIGSGRRRLVAMKKHSIEAQRLLDEPDAELAANGAAAGRSPGWSASERQIISMAADAIDRGVELAAAYAEAVDVKDKIKVSTKIRLQEMATTRLLSKVSTAVPAPESLRSIKARNAVNKRWHPDAG